MKLAFTLFLLFILLVFTAKAQGVSGRVLDSDNKPVEYYNLQLLDSKDSSFVEGLTFYQPDFQLKNLKTGNYILKISSLGYKDYSKQITLENNAVLVLPVINLQYKELGGVVVTARRPTIITKADRIMVKVEGSALAESSNGLEMLKHTPGISYDGRGNFSIPGKENAVFYINNIKATSMNEVKNLNPNAIKSIEIIDNPSVAYEAEGSAVVLITTKKQKESTLQLEGGITQSRKTAGWGSVEMVYSTQKFTTDLFYNYSHGNSWGRELNTRESDNFSLSTLGITNYRSYNHLVQLKLDYEIDKRQSLLLQTSINPNKDNGSRNDFTAFGEVGYTDFYTYKTMTDKSNELDAVLNYTFNIDSLGQKLLIASDINYHDVKSNSVYYNKLVNDTTSSRFINTISNYNYPFLFSIKADYTKPITQFLSMDLGAKYYTIESDAKSNLTGSTNLNQHYITKEQNIAGYVNGNFKVSEKLSFNAGLRLEDMHRSAIKDGVSYMDTIQIGFYPSMQLNYKISDNQNIGFSYSKKISRPSFDALDPSITKDSLFIRSGNPNLKSTDIHTFQLSLGICQDLQASVSYTYYKNPYFFLVHSDYDNPMIDVCEYINLSSKFRWIGKLIYNKSILKNWSISMIGTGYTNHFSYKDVDGLVKTNNKPSFSLDLTTTATFPFKIDFDGGIKYQSKGSWGAIYSYSSNNVYFSLQRKFLKDALNCTLSVNDLLNNSIGKQQSVLYGRNLNDFNADTRHVELTLRYVLGKSFFNKQINSGSDEERSRL